MGNQLRQHIKFLFKKLKRTLEKCSFLIYNGIDFEKNVNTTKKPRKASINEITHIYTKRGGFNYE